MSSRTSVVHEQLLVLFLPWVMNFFSMHSRLHSFRRFHWSHTRSDASWVLMDTLGRRGKRTQSNWTVRSLYSLINDAYGGCGKRSTRCRKSVIIKWAPQLPWTVRGTSLFALKSHWPRRRQTDRGCDCRRRRLPRPSLHSRRCNPSGSSTSSCPFQQLLLCDFPSCFYRSSSSSSCWWRPWESLHRNWRRLMLQPGQRVSTWCRYAMTAAAAAPRSFAAAVSSWRWQRRLEDVDLAWAGTIGCFGRWRRRSALLPHWRSRRWQPSSSGRWRSERHGENLDETCCTRNMSHAWTVSQVVTSNSRHVPLIHNAVDGWVVHGVWHGEPIDGQVDFLRVRACALYEHDHAVTRFTVIHLDVLCVVDLWMSVGQDEVDVVGQPADGEDAHHHDHHLDDLRGNARGMINTHFMHRHE